MIWLEYLSVRVDLGGDNFEEVHPTNTRFFVSETIEDLKKEFLIFAQERKVQIIEFTTSSDIMVFDTLETTIHAELQSDNEISNRDSNNWSKFILGLE